MINPDNPDNKPNPLMQYAGLAAQLAGGLLITVFTGRWLDKQVAWSIPVFVWCLPLLLIIGMMIKVIRDTSKK